MFSRHLSNLGYLLILLRLLGHLGECVLLKVPKKGEGTWEREEVGWRFDEDPEGGKAGVLGLL